MRDRTNRSFCEHCHDPVWTTELDGQTVLLQRDPELVSGAQVYIFVFVDHPRGSVRVAEGLRDAGLLGYRPHVCVRVSAALRA